MDPFEGKVRIRICGVLMEENRLLLVKHQGLGELGYFWSPPGGGIEFGETHENTLTREFREETGLEVEVAGFAGFHEHLDARYHALELFFYVKKSSGEISAGSEPEGNEFSPVLTDIAWLSLPELEAMPAKAFHSRCIPFLREMEGN